MTEEFRFQELPAAKDRGFWIVTAAMKRFELDFPEEHEFDVRAIAIALANENRYVGHTSIPYSVAQHAVLVSDWLMQETDDAVIAYQGLHHDDAEFVTGDIPSPVKKWLRQYTDALKWLEDSIDLALSKAFGIQYPHDPIVKEGDDRISLNEKMTFFSDMPDKWKIEQLGVQPLPNVVIAPQPFFVARQMFLDRHFALRKRIGLDE